MTGGIVPTDILGWLAAGLTFLAFSMRDMLSLRLAAVAANLSFIAWGLLVGLLPILALHLLLLPCNLYRLAELIALRRSRARSFPGSRLDGRTPEP